MHIGVSTIHAGLVRAKRAYAVVGIQIVGVAARHDVHRSAQGIGTEINGQYALEDLYMVGHISRQIGQIEAGAEVVHGYSVEEKLYLVARKAVHGKRVVAAHASVFAKTDA